jgi:outer membrane protein assembly factor BamE (lipoprotein component of BamABCDE complex)
MAHELPRNFERAFYFVSGVLWTACAFLALPVLLFGGLYALFYAFAVENTQYAEEYSAWDFMTIAPGMTAEEVRGALGEPLRRGATEPTDEAKPAEYWYYTAREEPGNQAHLIRYVVIDTSTGQVLETVSDWDSD